MEKAEMEKGFAVGRVLIQEEWSKPEEIRAVDELIAEGKAKELMPWRYFDNFQCKVRKIGGVK